MAVSFTTKKGKQAVQSEWLSQIHNCLHSGLKQGKCPFLGEMISQGKNAMASVIWGECTLPVGTFRQPFFKAAPCDPLIWALDHPKSKKVDSSVSFSRHRSLTGRFLLKVSIFLFTYNLQCMNDASISQAPSAIFTRRRPISPHQWFSALACIATSSRFQQRGIGRAWIRAEGNWGAGAGFKAGQSPAPRAELEGICCVCQMS